MWDNNLGQFLLPVSIYSMSVFMMTMKKWKPILGMFHTSHFLWSLSKKILLEIQNACYNDKKLKW